jgi:hypothetical protein
VAAGERTTSVTAATAMIAMMILGDRLRKMGATSLRAFKPLGDVGTGIGAISCTHRRRRARVRHRAGERLELRCGSWC